MSAPAGADIRYAANTLAKSIDRVAKALQDLAESARATALVDYASFRTADADGRSLVTGFEGAHAAFMAAAAELHLNGTPEGAE